MTVLPGDPDDTYFEFLTSPITEFYLCDYCYFLKEGLALALFTFLVPLRLLPILSVQSAGWQAAASQGWIAVPAQ